MNYFFKSSSLVLALAAIAALPAQAGGFKGVLNTPALATQLAAQRPLNAIVASASRLIAAGPRGHIIYSDDSGVSWKQAAVPVSSDLTAIHFSSQSNGWAVGHDGVVLHSGDAGKTWQLLLDGDRIAALLKDYYGQKAKAGDSGAVALLQDIERDFSGGPDKPFLDVWFANDQEGFIVGAFNLIFRTEDGGKTWEPWYDRIDNPRHLHLYSIRGQGDRLYVAGEQGFVARLDAGARRFETVRSPYAGSFFGILPLEGGAIVYGMRGNVYRINEKGEHWQKLDAGVVGGVTGVVGLDNGRVALVSTAGDVMVGKSVMGPFEKRKPPRDMSFAGVAFVSATQSLASVGSAGVSIIPLAPKQ